MSNQQNFNDWKWEALQNRRSFFFPLGITALGFLWGQIGVYSVHDLNYWQSYDPKVLKKFVYLNNDEVIKNEAEWFAHEPPFYLFSFSPVMTAIHLIMVSWVSLEYLNNFIYIKFNRWMGKSITPCTSVLNEVRDYQRIDSLCLVFRGLLLYSAVVTFHLEWCTRKPWSSSIISFDNISIAQHHHTNNKPYIFQIFLFLTYRLFLSDSDRFFGLSGSWYGSVFIYNQMGAPMWITQAIYIFVMVYSVVYITTRQQYYTFLEIPITLGGITLMYLTEAVRENGLYQTFNYINRTSVTEKDVPDALDIVESTLFESTKILESFSGSNIVQVMLLVEDLPSAKKKKNQKKDYTSRKTAHLGIEEEDEEDEDEEEEEDSKQNKPPSLSEGGKTDSEPSDPTTSSVVSSKSGKSSSKLLPITREVLLGYRWNVAMAKLYESRLSILAMIGVIDHTRGKEFKNQNQNAFTESALRSTKLFSFSHLCLRMFSLLEACVGRALPLYIEDATVEVNITGPKVLYEIILLLLMKDALEESSRKRGSSLFNCTFTDDYCILSVTTVHTLSEEQTADLAEVAFKNTSHLALAIELAKRYHFVSSKFQNDLQHDQNLLVCNRSFMFGGATLVGKSLNPRLRQIVAPTVLLVNFQVSSRDKLEHEKFSQSLETLGVPFDVCIDLESLNERSEKHEVLIISDTTLNAFHLVLLLEIERLCHGSLIMMSDSTIEFFKFQFDMNVSCTISGSASLLKLSSVLNSVVDGHEPRTIPTSQRDLCVPYGRAFTDGRQHMTADDRLKSKSDQEK